MNKIFPQENHQLSLFHNNVNHRVQLTTLITFLISLKNINFHQIRIINSFNTKIKQPIAKPP